MKQKLNTIIESKRLRLRPIALTDLEQVHKLNSLPQTDQYNTLGIPESIYETEGILRETIQAQAEKPPLRYVFCIENHNQHFMGMMGITMGKPTYKNAEVWYKLYPQYWNQGYATEALLQILNFCFIALKLHRVTAGCATENLASVKVLEKCGFIREGRCRKILPIRGQWVDNFEYAILEEDYFKNNITA